jgi:ArsR family transcriptional regulator, arsenate/arsenite/antimonite-responsive transcriptional repressor
MLRWLAQDEQPVAFEWLGDHFPKTLARIAGIIEEVTSKRTRVSTYGAGQRRKVLMSTLATTKEVTGALAALAQETRLVLFRLLVERGPDGLSAGVLAQRLGIPDSSLSFHLRTLQNARLITQRRVSRQLIYAADFTAMNALVRYLTENCCGVKGTCAPVCNPPAAMAEPGDEALAPVRHR